MAAKDGNVHHLFITHVEAVDSYLKFYGISDPNAMHFLKQKMPTFLQNCMAIDPTWPLERQQVFVQKGLMCLYKSLSGAPSSESEFMRVRVLSSSGVNGPRKYLRVEVEFVDYGYTKEVRSYELLIPNHIELLRKIPPLCNDYILLGICGDWGKDRIDLVKKIIKGQNVEFSLVYELYGKKFIRIKWKGFDFVEYLILHINVGGGPVSDDLLLEYFKENHGKVKPITNGSTKSTSSILNNNNYSNTNKNYSNMKPPAATINNNFESETSRKELLAEISVQKRNLTARLKSIQAAPPRYIAPYVGAVPAMPRNIPAGLPYLNNGGLNQNVPNYYQQPALAAFYAAAAAANIRPRQPFVPKVSLPPQRQTVPVIRFAAQPMPAFSAPVVNQLSKPLVDAKTSVVTSKVAPRRSTFKTHQLTVDQTYEVVVSYVQNGPSLFSVQLLKFETQLCAMMDSIEKQEFALKKLAIIPNKPLPPTACIARYSEDNHLYRALIVNVQQNSCKVVYVDYGNSEAVSFDNLYEIPEQFLEEKVFALSFCLSGIKSLEPMDDSLKKTFSERVSFQACKLKVVPLEGPPVLQYCQLTHQGADMLTVLKNFTSKRNVYPKAETLKDNDVVEIRYIDSPKRFFVQKVDNIQAFDKLMDEMFTYYNKNQIVPTDLHLGDPCIVKYDVDWYRGELIRYDETAIIIRHVDFGYEQKVTRNLLSVIAPQHLKMPRQAIQCCLKGFENNDVVKELATVQFEMLAEDKHERRAFSVKVFRIEPNGVTLLNLFTEELNLMKKLYKLSMPFEAYMVLEKSEFKFGKKSNSNAKLGQKSSILNSTSLQSDDLSDQDKQPSAVQKQMQQHLNSKQENQAQIPRSPSKKQVPPSNQKNKENFSSSEASTATTKPISNVSDKKGGNNKYQKSPIKTNNSVISDCISIHSSLSAGSMNKSQRSAKSSASSNIRSPKHNRQNRSAQAHQRPRNAPQGYSQSPSKQINISGYSSSGSKSNKSPSKSSAKLSEEYISLNQVFTEKPLKLPTIEEIELSWWVSPFQFYSQLKSSLPDYENLTLQMQEFYQNKPSQQLQLKPNSSVIVLNRREKTFYRARILSCNHMLGKYRVFCVDIGKQITVTSEDIWKVEKRFADLPCIAYYCSFDGVVSNFDYLHIISIMKDYIGAPAQLMCEFMRQSNNVYCVNILVNKLSLKEKFISDGVLSPVSVDMRLELLVGQQIRAKFCSIRDMLYFKIRIEGCDPNVQLLCSYDDIRFIKSNPDLSNRFKQFYENKSFVVNIKNVNEHKVIFLRPLLPLFKDDISTYICSYPIIFSNFYVDFMHIASPHRLYCVASEAMADFKQLLVDMLEYYDKSGEPLKKLGKDQICAMQSIDGNWYRGRIKSVFQKGDKIEVFCLDLGSSEVVRRANLKVLDERFYVERSAYAIELNLPIRTNIDLLHSSKKSGEVKNENDLNIEKTLKTMLCDKSFMVNALEIRHNHLIADVVIEGEGLLTDVLMKQGLIKSKDVEYMKKVLDKEKTNVFEYIETVDLTLEDEDERSQEEEKSRPLGSQENHELLKPPKEMDKQEIEIVSVEQISSNKSDLMEGASDLKLDQEVGEEPPKCSTPTSVTKEDPLQEAVANDPFEDMEQAVLSHCDNPAQFYVHLQDRIDELYKLQENLQIVATSLPPLMSVVNGANCISLYSVDKQWYRAKILDAELMVLRYTDFGNTDCVSDPTEVKEMSVFPDIEPFCIPCALPIRPNGTADWVDAANAIFNDSYNKKLYFEYITHGDFEKKSYIKLFIDGVNIAEQIVKDGFAKPLELVDSGESCFISHLNNISDFYIQYEKNSKALELIECYLADIQNLKTLKDFEKGKIIAALFPDDEMWYRAKLLKSLKDGTFEVLFIDYGNTSVTPECREISEEIAKLPALSTKCCLALPETCVAWSDAAEDKFAEIAATGETIFTVELYEPANDHAVVHLYMDGVNVNEDLRPLCESKVEEPCLELNNSFGNTTLHTTIYENDVLYDAIVSHVNSLADFFIQFNKNSERLNDINASLNALALEALENPEVGQMCAAIYEEDGLFYRARILEVITLDPIKCRCILVDYGNEVLINDLKALPVDLLEIRDLAKNCQFDCAYIDPSNLKRSREVFYEVLKDCEFVKVSIINDEVLPALVKLFNGRTDEDIEEKLQILLGKDEPSLSNHCVISHIISPDHFYLQLKKDSEKLETVRKALDEDLVKSQPLLDNIFVDEWCCVYSTEDNCFYRGSIYSIGTENHKIFAVDYGYTVTASKLYQLPKELEEIPPLALKCALKDFKPDDYAEDLAQERFNHLDEKHYGEILELVEDDYDSLHDIHRVRLQANYKDLLNELIEMLKSENGKVEDVIPELHNCTVVYTKSTQSFYIHLEKHWQAVEDLRSKLQNAETDFKYPENIKEGDILAAFADEFEEYYRAKVLRKEDDNKYAVHYIDYGNTSVTDKLLELPPDLKAMSSFALHCSLGNDSHLISLEFVEQFRDYINNRFAETFQIEYINTKSEPNIVKIFFQNKDVIKEVLEIIKTNNFVDAHLVPLPPSEISSTSGSLTSSA